MDDTLFGRAADSWVDPGDSDRIPAALHISIPEPSQPAPLLAGAGAKPPHNVRWDASKASFSF